MIPQLHSPTPSGLQVLPTSNSKKLSLRLIKVFSEDESEITPQQLATLRRGDYMKPKFARFEDREVDISVGRGSSAGQVEEEEDPFSWAAAGASNDAEEEEDPFAWAAAGASDDAEEEKEEDPFAWAAASTEEAGDAISVDGGEEEEDDDGPDFDQSYFDDKYDIDTY